MKVGRGSSRGGAEDDAAAGSGGMEAAPPVKRRRVAGAPAAGAGGSRRVQAEASPLQRLFQACRAVFRGPGTVPAPAEVDLLCSMLDKMKPEDVGLSAEQEFFTTREEDDGIPLIKNTTLYECENFTMVIFFLPQNAVIPLHDHPGMTVFSKLLIGSLHIRSYDWVDPEPAPSCCNHLRLAKRVVNGVFTAPCDTSVLYPTTGGNMHRFRARAPCAILDILGPPYSMEDDRDCTYYSAVPYSRHSTKNDATEQHAGVDQEGHRLSWLKETIPRELRMRRIRYGGPPISDE
ncbi:plant cysteine oxidase 2-like isoform X2 [Oryza brachyantha]|uniref:plant cysteine oxidase 2-like isoform X2 n=1 Tax=Oryza brachyantha TaxID=4533 RepID=UPI001ADA458A|nr:plant cysteine oxidase 2-like isoform X2 [Oryza brachyantha]